LQTFTNIRKRSWEKIHHWAVFNTTSGSGEMDFSEGSRSQTKVKMGIFYPEREEKYLLLV